MNGFYFTSIIGELAFRISLCIKHRQKLAVFVVNKFGKPFDHVINAKPNFVITGTQENVSVGLAVFIKSIELHVFVWSRRIPACITLMQLTYFGKPGKCPVTGINKAVIVTIAINDYPTFQIPGQPLGHFFLVAMASIDGNIRQADGI